MEELASGVEVPLEMACPITGLLMSDPVIDNDGFSYERSAIEAWLAKNPVSPMTRSPLFAHQLRPNRALKAAIDAFRAANPSWKPRRVVPVTEAAAAVVAVTAEAETKGVLMSGQEEAASVVHVVVEVATGAGTMTKRPAADVVCVLDRSGSMEGDKLAQSKTGISLLIDQHVQAGDTLSLVTYDDRAEVVFAGLGADDKAAMKRAVEGVVTGGSTDIGAGLIAGALALGLPADGTLFNERNTGSGEVELAKLVFTAAKTDEPLTMAEKTSKPANVHQHWRWTVQVEPAAATAVETVEFELHPSFSPSHVCLRPEELPLVRVGWGTFEIGVVINFCDGRRARSAIPMSFSSSPVHVSVRTKDVFAVAPPAAAAAAAAVPAQAGERVKRIFLFSDGQCNHGALRQSAQLSALAGEIAVRGAAIFCFGLGRDYNEDLMTAIAKEGRGQMTHIASPYNIAEYVQDAFQLMSESIGTRAVLTLAPAHDRVKVTGLMTRGANAPIQLHDLRCNDRTFIGVALTVDTRGVVPGPLAALAFELSYVPIGCDAPSVVSGTFSLLLTDDAKVAASRNVASRSVVLTLRAADLDKEVSKLVDADKRKEAIAVKEQVVAMLREAAELDPTGVATEYLQADIKALGLLKSREDDAAVRKANAYTSYSKGGCSSSYAGKMKKYAAED